MNTPPAGLETKTAVLDRPAPGQPVDALSSAAVSSVNPLGIVTALVAVTGVRDHVGDVIPAGAFARTLRERQAHPRLLHHWHRPIGNTLGLRELPPGHPELPKQAPDGRPWPAEAGALVARYRLDLSTKDGRRALAWAQGKLGTPPWYSIGYVPVRTRFINGSRYLDDLDLWEYSMVHRPANDLAFQVDVKSLANLVDSEHQVPPESIEVKVRYVRDAAYWGYPVGTPITASMKPKGRAAVRLRRAGRVPARTVGVTAEKPTQGARSKPAKPEEEADEGLFDEPDTEATRVRASEAATGDIEGAVTSLIAELENERRGEPDRFITGLLHEGETPAELAEDLRSSENWSVPEDERDDLIESVLADYRAAYAERLKQQAARRAAAAAWTPPSREAFDRVAAAATQALDNFEDKPLIEALADLGHDDPEGFAAFLSSEDTSLKKARTALASFIDERRGSTESSGDIGERIGDLSDRDDQDLLSLRRDVIGELDLDEEDEATITAAEAAVDAEIQRRGIIALRDVKPGDVFEFDGKRYYVAPDGSLIDPEGELANLPRTGYQGRPAKLIERDAPAPVRRVDAEQLAASTEHVVADAPAGALSPADYDREHQRADARRARAENITEEHRQADKEAGWAAAAEQLAETAPAQLDLAALQARRQLISTASERRRPIELGGGGRLGIVGTGGKGWKIVTGSGLQLVAAHEFDDAKPPGKRAMADLANRLASLSDAAGRPAPFTATYEQQGSSDRPDWIRGWRDAAGRSLPEAAAAVIGEWAQQNGLTFRHPARNYRSEPTVPGGVPDADGFLTRHAEEAAPGDEIRLPDGSIGTVERNGRHGDGSNFDQIILTDGRTVPIPKAIGAPMDVRFADDPDAPEAQQDPGMGNIAATVTTPPGAPITIAADQWERRWPYDYDRPLEPGTRLVELPALEPATLTPQDHRPRVGVAMARLDNAGGHTFQTVRFDDGTYAQLNVEALRRRGENPKRSTYVLDPTPEQVNAARAAWGLPPDENAGPGGGAPPPAPRREFVPTPAPRPAPESLSPREQQTRTRMNEGPRAYGQWVRNTATDEELAEEEQILLQMRNKMPITGASNATAFTHFNQRYVQPVRRERERRAAQAERVPEPEPEPEPPPVPEPEPEPELAELPVPDPNFDPEDHPRPPGTWRLMFTKGGAELAERGWRVRDVREQDRDRWVRRLEGNGWTVHAFPPEAAPEPEPVPEPEPPPPEPPVVEPPSTVELPVELVDEAAVLSDEVLGLLEQPDGSLEVTPEVGDRQDRVAELLDGRAAGTLDLGQRSTEQLTGDRDDLSAELALQTALERRTPRVPREPRTPGVPRETPPAEPGVRPGLVGAAQDHAEALRSGDTEAITRTRARLESSLRRSRAGSQAARQLADHVTDADISNDPEQIEALANLIRAETRARRAAGARKRRTVRRLERERIRSLLGEVEAELGARGTARFDADLAALSALDKHRHDTAKRIGAMIAPKPGWIGGAGPYHRKHIIEALRRGDYFDASNRAHVLEDFHRDMVDIDPTILSALDNAEARDSELRKAAPFPPATGGTPAKRATLNRAMLGAVQGLDPDAVRELGAVKIERRRKIGKISADAWYSWGPRHLSVATDLFDDPNLVARMTRSEGNGWFITSGFEDYFTRSLHHELGHHLHGVTLRHVGERALFEQIAQALNLPALEAAESPADWHKRHVAAIVDRVGTYAGHDHYELIAELWTEYRGQGADASSAAQVVGRALSRPISPDVVLPPVPGVAPPAPEPRTPPAPPLAPMSDSEYEARVKVVESAVNAALADGRSSAAQYTVRGEGQVWLPERAAAHREVIEALWSRGRDAPNEGKALLSGGLGGAGKSTVLQRVVDPKDYLTINSDDVKVEMAARGMIPEIAGLTPMESVALVHEESSYLANLLAARAYAERKNVLWDITMGSPGGTTARIADLKQAGYTEINAVFVDIPVETSVSRALARHRRGLEAHRNGEGLGGRFVPPQVIRSHAAPDASSVNRKVFDGLREQFDGWAIYDNSVFGQPPKLVDGVGALAAQAPSGSTAAGQGPDAGTLAANYLTMHGTAGARARIAALAGKRRRTPREDALLSALRGVLTPTSATG